MRIVLFAGLVLLFSSLLMQYPFHTAMFNAANDAISYKIASEWLYSPDHFASFTRPFLFPLLIGLPHLLGFEYSEYNAAVLNFVLWFSTVLLLFRLIEDISNKKKAFKATLAFASCVSLHCFIFLVHTEVLYCFILLTHVFCLFQYLKTHKNNWFYSAIWLLGASVVIRPTLTYFVFALYLVLVVLMILKKIDFKKFALISLLLFSTVGLQLLNMYRCANSFKISYIGDRALYLYFSAYASNLKNYPNQTIDFYAKEWSNEIVRRRKAVSLIDNYHTRTDAQKLPAIEKHVKEDMQKQLSDNKWGLTLTFFRSLFVNSRSGTQYALSAKNGLNLPFFDLIQQFFLRLSQIQNIVNSSFILFVLPIIFIKRFQKHHSDQRLIIAMYTWFLAFSIIVFSTISFTQGDRFHVVTVPLTLVAVALLFSKKRVEPQIRTI